MNIKKLRKEKNWSQRQLAEKLEVTTRTVQNWERYGPDKVSELAIKYLTTK